MAILYQLLFSLVLATALAGLAMWRRALTGAGLVWAWCLAVVIAFCGGLAGFLSLAATFVCTILAGRISKTVREPIEQQLHEKTGRRDAVQIVCNVLTGAVMLFLKSATGREMFLWAYGGAMAASLADSLASELGILSKAQPRNVCTWKPMERGLSGAVTPLGLVASLLGAAIVAAVCAPLWGYGGAMFLGVTAAGVIAALCDSVLGALVQAKYRCPACGALTEKKRHCSENASLEKGFRFVTNDVVNFCNNLIGAGAAILFYLIYYFGN